MTAFELNSTATMRIEAELKGRALAAQIVRFDIPEPTDSVLADPTAYQLNMCLTPRPILAEAGYYEHWGPHRFERLGDIFLIPPGEQLSVKGGSVRQASLLCYLQAEAVHAAVGQPLSWREQQLLSTLDIASARIRSLLFRLADEVRHPGIASDRMLELLSGELAIELGRYCLDQVERPVAGGLAGWRLRLIDERLSNNSCAPSLKELAAICNISIRQLTRGFRVSRGCSVSDYIEQRRIEAAKRRLMTGESVKSIAFALGFSSPSSFSFAFRRAAGISPSQFRQRQSRGLTAPVATRMN